MDPPLSRSEARAFDRLAMEELGIPGIVLMENAARGTAAVARTMLSERGAVAVLCGPGNNGGDGLAIARHLHGDDYRVTVHAPVADYRGGSDAAVNLRIVRALGLEIRRDLEPGPADLVVDALFGTGLARPLGPPWSGAVARLNAAGRPVLAVDIPSGLDADTGAVLGAAVRADATATMVAPKAGFYAGEGPRLVGAVTVVDIGAPRSLLARVRGTTAR